MRNDFGMFILSHGRAGNVLTFDTLRRCGYTGKIFIVIDDQDEQQEDYKKEYGDCVIVFDKREWAEKTDTIKATCDLRSVVFARNACYEIAKQLNMRYFCEFDDDLEEIRIRYLSDNKLRGKRVEDFDSIVDCMISFMESDNRICSLSFGLDFDYIGGKNGQYQKKLERMCFGFYFLRVDNPVPFIGITCEDMNAALKVCDSGNIMFRVFDIMAYSPERTTNEGGNFSLYNSMTKYVRNFYPVIVCPSGIKIKPNHDIKKYSDYIFPMIIGGRWKK